MAAVVSSCAPDTFFFVSCFYLLNVFLLLCLVSIFRFCTIKFIFELLKSGGTTAAQQAYLNLRLPDKKACLGAVHEKTYTIQAYRLASGGEANHVRVSAKDNVGVSGLLVLWTVPVSTR